MQTLAFTTDKISWTFLWSAIHRIQTDEVRVPANNLNLEAVPCIVLCCLAVEAFVNEVSSLTHAFLSDSPKGNTGAISLQEIVEIRTDSHGSFYDRYKRLICDLSLKKPQFLADLSTLKRLRDAVVHFRECDVPIIKDSNGVIREGQELPTSLAPLQTRRYGNRPLVADDAGTSWTLRIATDAMAAWSVNLALDAAVYVLDHLPASPHRDFILRAYAARGPAHGTLYVKGKNDLETWWRNAVQTYQNEAH